jgi:hypothetical protein
MPDNDPTYPAGPPAAAPPAEYPPQPAYAAQPAQQVVYQQVPVPVPVPVQQQPAARPMPEGARPDEDAPHHPQVTIISHSSLFYWWPVWVVGYLMTLFTWMNGESFALGDATVRLHPSNNLGVLFVLTLFLVVLITNVSVRGLASLVVILILTLAAVLMAYFQVWDDALAWLGNLTVYLNQGAYFWLSTLMLIAWALSVFIFDRVSYWVVKPGQITRQHFWGAGSESYDTENLTLEKRRDDLFRHWLLGLGSGDLKIHTYGGQSREIFIPNVLFVGFKVHAIQHLIAQEPADFGHPTVQ